MASFDSRLGIVSVGSAVPDRIVTNAELSERLDTSDEWIVARTGIRERRVAADGETASVLGLRAAEEALDRSGLAPAELDQVIVATCTPDAFFPSTAALVADRLGAHSASAFDVSAACTGYVYALVQAAGQVQAGLAEHVLVIGSETFSRLVDWDDRATCVLFGDGAAATVVSASAQEPSTFGAELGADGSRGDDLVARAFAAGPRFVEMNGPEVFRFATRAMVDSVGRLLDRCALGIDAVDWLVPHQANLRIIEHATKRLQIDPSRVLTNLERFGNTSAASIPLVLDEAWRDGRLKRGDRVVMVGFGGGLTWGSCLTTWAARDARGAGGP